MLIADFLSPGGELLLCMRLIAAHASGLILIDFLTYRAFPKSMLFKQDSSKPEIVPDMPGALSDANNISLTEL